ncbi:MAG: hypothetical protein WCP60_00485 [bacterium]
MKFPPILIGFLSLGIAVADTPRILDDPEAFIRSHPKLSSQRQWTEFATSEQIALFSGPETVWPLVPPSDYDLTGFDQKRLYSKVPPPGIHPRILFSPEDVPVIKKQLESSINGRQLLAQTDFVLSKTIYEMNSDEGKIFAKLSSGDLSGLEWLIDEKTGFIQHYFKGYKLQGKLTPHAGYLPRLMEAAAFRALIDNDEVKGKELAAAMSNYWKLREPLIDKVNADKDSPPDYWRSYHQLVSATNLGFGYDLAAKWMTSEQREQMRRVIAKATSGKLSYGENGPTRWRDTNWTSWDLTHFLTSLAIEGEEGYDPEIRKVASKTLRDYLTWGIDRTGVIFEPNGKNGGGLLFGLTSGVALARRGENYLGHPHLRKLTSAQAQDVVPQGGINVNNGTWGCAPFWGNLASFLKALYPDDKSADWLIRQARPDNERTPDAAVASAKTHPSLDKLETILMTDIFTTLDWKGFMNKEGILKPSWNREDLHLPNVFNDPVHGLFVARSGDQQDALFLMFEARPDLRHIGHQHHDSGHFYLASGGVMWAVEASPKSSYSADHNTVQIDGKGHSDVAAAPRVRFLGVETNGPLILASSDLKNAYDCGWTTPSHFSWHDPAFDFWKITLETDPDVVAHFKGTQHYKMRLWGDDYTRSNWGPTMRIEGNPVKFAFRSAGIVNGKHPYALIIDDISKDGSSHQYDWLMQVPSGTRMLPAPSHSQGSPVSVILTRSVGPGEWDRMEPLETLPKGTPGLMLCFLGLENSEASHASFNEVGSENAPVKIEQLAGSMVVGGSPLKSRLDASQKGIDPCFRILLIPVKGSEALPTVTYDPKSSAATVDWPGQKDRLRFSKEVDQRSRVRLERQ